MILAELRQIGIEEAQSVRRFDDPNADGALLFHDLIPEGLHPGPMHLGPEMMLGVVTIKEPDPIIEFVVATYTLRDWFVRIAAIMQVITVQVGEAMAKVPEAEEKHDVVPVQDTEYDKGGEEENELGDSPECFSFVLAHKRLENGDGIFSKEAEECVAERMLGLAVV